MMEVKNLVVGYKESGSWGLSKSHHKIVIKNISFKIEKGTALAILGESGSGKSTLGKVICGLLKPISGDLNFGDQRVYGDKKGKKMLQSQIAVVFQDYLSSVNPRFTIKGIISESIILRGKREGKKLDIDAEVERLLELVGLNRSFIHRFSHELSGGQLQRVCIARAIALNPKLILMDEAVSSLDIHTQVQIMDLLKKLQKDLDLTYIFITHDLMTVTYLCSDVIFIDQGVIVEEVPVSELHLVQSPYANKLIGAVIGLDEVV